MKKPFENVTHEKFPLFKEEMAEKIKNDKGYKMIKEIFNNNQLSLSEYKYHLTGGAIVDIIFGRIPKDYDIITTDSTWDREEFCNLLLYYGFKFQYETKYASTFIKEGMTFQVLKTKIEDFDFKIGQSRLNFDNGRHFRFDIDYVSLKEMTLIPTTKSFFDPKYALNALRRIPHWKKKGFAIDERTYLSLLDTAFNLNKPLNS